MDLQLEEYLKRRLAEAEDRDYSQSAQQSHNIMRGADTIAAAIGGIKPQSEYYDSVDKQAYQQQRGDDAIVRDYLKTKYDMNVAQASNKYKADEFDRKKQQDEIDNKNKQTELSLREKQLNATTKLAKEKEQDRKTEKNRLSPNDLRRYNEGNAIPSMLDDIEKTIEKYGDDFGPIEGMARSLNPWDTNAKSIDADMRSASQAFGRFMEGGVLRKEDEEKYRKMFPQQSDTKEVAKNKLAIVRRILIKKQQSDIEALRTAGYDVGPLENTKFKLPAHPLHGDAPPVVKPEQVDDADWEAATPEEKQKLSKHFGAKQ